MTKAEKMAHDIGIDWYAEDGINIQDDAIEKLIHQVAERTAQGCAKIYEERMMVGKDVTVNFMVALIRDAANWVKEEEDALEG